MHDVRYSQSVKNLKSRIQKREEGLNFQKKKKHAIEISMSTDRKHEYYRVVENEPLNNMSLYRMYFYNKVFTLLILFMGHSRTVQNHHVSIGTYPKHDKMRST